MKFAFVMNDERRVRWTRILVLAGIFLSYLSYGTKKVGLGELYPFADWRLYSAPVGINEPATTYRIYALDEETGSWQRQAIEPSRAYSRKDAWYVLSYWTRRVLDDSTNNTGARERLATVASELAPHGSSHRIVAETYYSLPLFADSSLYDTSTVARFDR